MQILKTDPEIVNVIYTPANDGEQYTKKKNNAIRNIMS
jgi:hypothetical protein